MQGLLGHEPLLTHASVAAARLRLASWWSRADIREVAQKPHGVQGLSIQLFLNSAAAILGVIWRVLGAPAGKWAQIHTRHCAAACGFCTTSLFSRVLKWFLLNNCTSRYNTDQKWWKAEEQGCTHHDRRKRYKKKMLYLLSASQSMLEVSVRKCVLWIFLRSVALNTAHIESWKTETKHTAMTDHTAGLGLILCTWLNSCHPNVLLFLFYNNLGR
jgi:hypothetical protein